MFGNPTSQMCTFAPILFRTSLVESMISGPTPSPGIKVTGTRPGGNNCFEIIVTIFSRVKQPQKGEQDKRNRSQGEGSQYFADKNDGKPRVTESIGCLIRRVRKDLDKNKESHLESTLALWPEAVDKSWACWRVGKEACWMVGKEASLTMRERGSMLIWKRRIVIKAFRTYIQSSYLFLPHPPNEGLHKGSPGSSERQRTELDAMSVWHSWSLEWDAFSYQRGGTLKIHNVW